jgi:hypothetical protein
MVNGVGWHAPEPEAMGVVCTEDSRATFSCHQRNHALPGSRYAPDQGSATQFAPSIGFFAEKSEGALGQDRLIYWLLLIFPFNCGYGTDRSGNSVLNVQKSRQGKSELFVLHDLGNHRYAGAICDRRSDTNRSPKRTS